MDLRSKLQLTSDLNNFSFDIFFYQLIMLTLRAKSEIEFGDWTHRNQNVCNEKETCQIPVLNKFYTVFSYK